MDVVKTANLTYSAETSLYLNWLTFCVQIVTTLNRFTANINNKVNTILNNKFEIS